MPESILVVNMNYLGDALLTTPALSALRHAYPDARIDTIVGAGTVDILRGNSDVSAVIPRRAGAGMARLVELYRLLHAGRYTTVIHLPPIPAYAAAAWLARTPRRIGQDTPQMAPFLTERRQVMSAHLADRMLDTMPLPADYSGRVWPLKLVLDAAAQENAQRLLAESGLGDADTLIAVNVGATRPQKRWQALAFADLLDALSPIPCLLVGAGADDALLAGDALQRAARRDVVNLVGRTDVPTLAAVLARCGALVSADSGPMHIASAVGTPTVALFGSTDPALTGPYDIRSVVLDVHLPCAPCFKHPTCGGRYDCMRDILPATVALAVRDVLRRRTSPQTLPMATTGIAPGAGGAA